MSFAVELSVSRGVPVAGHGCPISTRAARIGQASLAPRKIPPVSDSAAEAGTPLMVFTITWRGPLGVGLVGLVVGLSVCVKRVVQRLRAFGSTN